MSQQTIEADTPAEPKPMPRISVKAAYVRLAATCRADHDIRYYLRGILIEPRPEGGAFIVGTNGHMLIAIIDKDAECSASTIISPTKALIAACPKATPWKNDAILRTIEVEGQTALGVTDDRGLLKFIQAHDTTIEAKFPDLKRVLPVWDKLEVGGPEEIEPHYRNAPLAAINAGKHFGVNCYHDPVRSMLVQRLAGMDNVVHIVMARRLQHERKPWVDLWSAVKAA
jgi:hypothetical protein